MNSYLQIKTILFSFLYGVFFYITAKYNLIIIKNLNTLKKYIISLVYVIDLVLLYIYLIYKLNNGIFHIYFVISILIGFYITSKRYKNSVNKCKVFLKRVKKKSN